MKLRILGNYIRIRLSQSEFKDFESNGEVITKTDFVDQSLIYRLKKDEHLEDMEASYSNNRIDIKMPANWAKKWSEPEEVSVENANQENIRILIEKDFECLHKNSQENGSDPFPNPLAKKR